nr:hypothetical protein [Mycoplasmopsis bovis]
MYTINGKKYFNYGLHIMPRSYVPYGGASGSSVRNKNNELIAVFHTANNSAKTGLVLLHLDHMVMIIKACLETISFLLMT